jgi:hypothetical protein
MLAIAEYRYDLSAKFYLEGYSHLYAFAAEGRIFGDCPLRPGWGERIMPPDQMRWTWVFHQTEGAPVTKGLELLPGSRCGPSRGAAMGSSVGSDPGLTHPRPLRHPPPAQDEALLGTATPAWY